MTSSLPSLGTLQPGAFRTITQATTVNVVFVGYHQGAGVRDVDKSRFLAELPGTSCAHKRMPSFYGLEQPVGLCFDLDYKVVYADQAFEDSFFRYLASIAAPAERTAYQDLYNEQAARSLDVAANHRIDAPSVEAWLASHGPDAGVDTTQYTIFFVNWYGRPDFEFHVYTKTDEPDPDTGFNYGLTAERALISWGGTPGAHRVWFHDLSAGPEDRTANWNLTDDDVDGSGTADYRMPPVWEYGNLAAYRPFDDLAGDLGKVARYVPIDLLFFTSPLFDPAISAPVLPTTINVDVNMFLQDPTTDPETIMKPAVVAAALQDLQPVNQFTVDLTDYPLEGRVQEIFDCFFSGYTSGPVTPCFGAHKAYKDLLIYFFGNHLFEYIDGDVDHEVPVFYFLTPEVDRLAVHIFGAVPGPLEGVDDNWTDGTQTYIVMASSPRIFSLGHGGTKAAIHETGHYLGMSHPHDGYDYETGHEYTPYDVFIANGGDEVHSAMSYIELTHGFGQFDRDNMSRYLTAIYINQANVILGLIAGSPDARLVAGQLQAADEAATDALAAYMAMDYATAAARAKAAHAGVLAAAAAAHVQVEPEAHPADLKAQGASAKFTDAVDAIVH